MQPILLRTLDIIFSLIGIIFGLPIMLVIFVIGLYINGSPLFFQQRVGKNQKLFTLMKFRTMSLDTGSVGTHLVDAASITPELKGSGLPFIPPSGRPLPPSKMGDKG